MKTRSSQMSLERYSTSASRRLRSRGFHGEFRSANALKGLKAPRLLPWEESFSTGCFSRRVFTQPRVGRRRSVFGKPRGKAATRLLLNGHEDRYKLAE